MTSQITPEEQEQCPRCSTVMISGQAPFKVEETVVGHYDSMKCPHCGYSYFTEKDYEGMMDDAKAVRDSLVKNSINRPSPEPIIWIPQIETKASATSTLGMPVFKTPIETRNVGT